MPDKHQRFVTLAEHRTRRAIKDIRLVGNLSNRASYHYSPRDVKQILTAIESELQAARHRFQEAQSGNSAPEFSLS